MKNLEKYIVLVALGLCVYFGSRGVAVGNKVSNEGSYIPGLIGLLLLVLFVLAAWLLMELRKKSQQPPPVQPGANPPAGAPPATPAPATPPTTPPAVVVSFQGFKNFWKGTTGFVRGLAVFFAWVGVLLIILATVGFVGASAVQKLQQLKTWAATPVGAEPFVRHLKVGRDPVLIPYPLDVASVHYEGNISTPSMDKNWYVGNDTFPIHQRAGVDFKDLGSQATSRIASFRETLRLQLPDAGNELYDVTVVLKRQ